MYYNSNRFILITNLECRLVTSSLRSLIIAVSWDTVECPSPDKVEHSDSRLTDELPFTSAEKVKKNVLVEFCMLHVQSSDMIATAELYEKKKQFWCIQAIFFNNLLKYNTWTKCTGQNVCASFTLQLSQNTVFLS